MIRYETFNHLGPRLVIGVGAILPELEATLAPILSKFNPSAMFPNPWYSYATIAWALGQSIDEYLQYDRLGVFPPKDDASHIQRVIDYSKFGSETISFEGNTKEIDFPEEQSKCESRAREAIRICLDTGVPRFERYCREGFSMDFFEHPFRLDRMDVADQWVAAVVAAAKNDWASVRELLVFEEKGKCRVAFGENGQRLLELARSSRMVSRTLADPTLR
ncbi:MAG: hypothetical protein ABL931_23380 [Usitatibacteraceae bacterium]